MWSEGAGGWLGLPSFVVRAMMRDAFVRHYHKISKWLEISFAQQQSLVCSGRGGPMKFSIIVPLAAPAAAALLAPCALQRLATVLTLCGGWRGAHTKLSRPHHDSQLGVPIVLDDAAAMPHFRSRSYLCTQHDYPLSAYRPSTDLKQHSRIYD